MDILTIINYIIFAIVFTLFLIELGTAILVLADYKKYRNRTSSYIAPIWEITGTFSIFYIVNLEASYPSILPIVGGLYIFPVLLAATFLIIRDAFLGYGEFITNKKSELTYSKIYGVCTLIFMFLILSVLTSSITGTGVNLGNTTINFLVLLINPFNLLMFIAILCLVTFAASIFFEVRDPSVQIVSIFVAVLIIVYATSTYAPAIFVNLLNNIWYILPPFVLLVGILYLHAIRHKFTKALTFAWLFLSTLTFEILGYPWLFGSMANINSYLTPSVNTVYVVLFTALGGIFLAAALGYFIFVHNAHRKTNQDY